MKILIVASNMVHINNFHLPYIEKFKKEGHSVYIMAKGEEADFNIPFVKSTLSFKNLLLAKKIKKILKEQSFDAIYLHTSLASFWVRVALIGIKKKPVVVNTVHGYLFGKSSNALSNFIYLTCEKLLKGQTDYIAVMNNEDYEIATKHKLCKKEVYFINGMGVKFKEGKIDKLPKDSDKTNLTFVGEISKRKNQLFLVKAMSYLPNCTLTLVGDGSERKKIERCIEKRNLQNRVKITGFTKKAYEYINSCDIYVSASKIEGLPFNIMEAMYLKKPIIATDIKGHTDLLDKKMLFTVDDMDAFVSLIKDVSCKTVEYGVDKYSLEKVLNENMGIYLSLCEGKTQLSVV